MAFAGFHRRIAPPAQFAVVALQLLRQQAAFDQEMHGALVQAGRRDIGRLLDAHQPFVVVMVADDVADAQAGQQVLGEAAGVNDHPLIIERLERRQRLTVEAQLVIHAVFQHRDVELTRHIQQLAAAVDVPVGARPTSSAGIRG